MEDGLGNLARGILNIKILRFALNVDFNDLPAPNLCSHEKCGDQDSVDNKYQHFRGSTPITQTF